MAESGESGSRVVLFAAMAANLGIAVAKFVAAALTGSSAMLTEGFHSVVDTLNQLLLLYGQHRARRPADKLHPLGYGREIYFWSFVVAILIFATGAGLSIYEGVLHILHPARIADVIVSYVVLGIAAAMEGASFIIARREFAANKGEQGWWRAIRRSKDPPTFIVLFEDSAALVGIAIAAGGIALSHATGRPYWDGAASIAIGVVLAVVAMLLARESKDLLLGERADPALIRAIDTAVRGFDGVVGVGRIITVHIAPERVFVSMEVDFEDAMMAGRLEQLVAEIEAKLRHDQPIIAELYIKPKTGCESAKDDAAL